MCDDIRRGACVVVALPRLHPRGFAPALERFLYRHTSLTVAAVRQDQSAPPVDALYRACRLPRPDGAVNARTLAECEAFQGCVAFVDVCDDPDPEPWLAVAARYADLVRNRAEGACGQLCVVVYEERGELPSEGPALRVRRWRDVVSGLDVRTLVRGTWAESAAGPSGLHEHLREALIAELAGGDLELAVLLHDRDTVDLLSPHGHLRDYAARAAWSLDDPPRLEHGSAHLVDGHLRAHVARLAMDDQRARELQRHLWRAGVQVLLPYIEDERWAAVMRWRPHLEASLRRAPLRTATGHVITSPDELEVAHLVERLRGGDGAEEACRWLRLLADIRNDLAHLRPATTERVLQLLDLAPVASLMGRR
ncbi:MAG: hypothetical protein U0324_22950 [Polyangiales bacterium]